MLLRKVCLSAVFALSFSPSVAMAAEAQPIPNGPVLTRIPLSGHPEAVGSYTGGIFLYDRNLQPVFDGVGGFDSFRLNKDGSYTGRGRIIGKTFTLKGQLDAALGESVGTASLPVALTQGQEVTLVLTLSTGSDGTLRLTGKLSGLPGVTDPERLAIDLVRAGDAAASSLQAGNYTALILARPEAGLHEPQGNGVASFTVNSRGALRCQYVLADGTPGTRAAALSGRGVWQFYFPAAGGAAALGGLVTGQMKFPEAGAAATLSGWFSHGRAADGRRALWSHGFDVQCAVVGAKYVPPARGTLTGPQLAGGADNALLTTTLDGRAAGQIPVTWAAQDSIRGDRTTLRVNRATGLITGTQISPTTGQKRAIHAVVIQPAGGAEAVVSGFYQDETTSGWLAITPLR